MVVVDQTVDQIGRHLFRKRGIYYYSRRVPKRLQTRFQRVRVVASLHTRCIKQARTASVILTAQLDAVWGQLYLEDIGIRLTGSIQQPSPVQPPLPTAARTGIRISDAHQIYLKLKGRGKSDLFYASTERNIGYAKDCLGDAELTVVGRTEAGKFRDYLIDRGLTTVSIKRVFSTVRAAFNLAISEHGLDFHNPFSGTFIPEVGKKKTRPPISPTYIRSIQRECMATNDENGN